MSFKIKNRKKKNVDNRITIDAKHNNQLKYYDNKRKNLINLEKELKDLKNEVIKYDNKDLKDLTNEEYNNKDILDDKIYHLNEEIKKIKSCVEEKEYYINTSNLLFDYYSNNNVVHKEVKKN